jgi:hypothetical protein
LQKRHVLEDDDLTMAEEAGEDSQNPQLHGEKFNLELCNLWTSTNPGPKAV